MKVKYINKGYFDNITIGKTYLLALQTNKVMVVINDKGKDSAYPKTSFKKLSIIEKLIDKIKTK